LYRKDFALELEKRKISAWMLNRLEEAFLKETAFPIMICCLQASLRSMISRG